MKPNRAVEKIWIPDISMLCVMSRIPKRSQQVMEDLRTKQVHMGEPVVIKGRKDTSMSAGQ